MFDISFILASILYNLIFTHQVNYIFELTILPFLITFSTIFIPI